jgi:hypothetical protein
MNLLERARESLKEHPGAWILVALLAISVYGNYQNGHRLTLVCENIRDMMAESPMRRDMLAAWQRNEADEIDNICSERDE